MLYAVTSYFNPCRYRKRLENYRLFRRYLGVPLITVELGFDGQFDLSPEDAEFYLPLGDGDVMFQKERLLNLAIGQLPDDCTAVAWLDCDVIFSDASWAEQTLRQLRTKQVVQPFATLYPLEASSPVDFRLARRSLPAHPSVPVNLAADPEFCRTGQVEARYWQEPEGTRTRFRTGIAWAARRDFLERVGLYDVCILGSGDIVFSSALYNCPQVAVDAYRMGPEFRQHFLDWFQRLEREFPLKIGEVPGEVLQLWHGSYSRRKYRQRHAEFAAFDFQPQRDLRISASGCWRWRNPDSPMAAYVRDYFHSRQEDGPLSSAPSSA
ncbi:MAG: hypothetical protein KDA79_12510 [Planctomycetaceae bacterium]|nr:hypothetical protein [Planctomycetaceae bacterium]